MKKTFLVFSFFFSLITNEMYAQSSKKLQAYNIEVAPSPESSKIVVTAGGKPFAQRQIVCHGIKGDTAIYIADRNIAINILDIQIPFCPAQR